MSTSYKNTILKLTSPKLEDKVLHIWLDKEIYPQIKSFCKTNKIDTVNFKILYVDDDLYIKPFFRYFSFNNRFMGVKEGEKIEKWIGVEIGVDQGLDLQSFFRVYKKYIGMVYLVDPYEKYDGYDDEETFKEYTPEESYGIMKSKMKPYSDIVKIIKKKSEDCVNEIPNNLDFVYIDGNHSYEYVKKDIELYYPKL